MSTEKKSAGSRTVKTPSTVPNRIGEMLVGAWKLTGGSEGEIRYEWLEGGFVFIQHVPTR